jgi:fermentation-respiration switch protein FrsA (DUF1100 family)
MIPTRDQLVPVTWQYDLASRIPGARVVTLEGAFHEVVWTHPGQVVDALEEFFGHQAEPLDSGLESGVPSRSGDGAALDSES